MRETSWKAAMRSAGFTLAGFTLFEVLVALFIFTSLILLSSMLWFGSDRARIAAVRDEELLTAYELLLTMWTPVLDGGMVPTPRPDDVSLLAQANEAIRAYLGTTLREGFLEPSSLKHAFDQVKNAAIIPCYTLTPPDAQDNEAMPPPLIENEQMNGSDYTEDDHYVRFLYRITVGLGTDGSTHDCENRKPYRVTLYTTVLLKK
ncbi:MAG: prepilin-type N-terminal cleavage/methylation domain-containing protein [Candidatus Carbobacillus sp.]|nr:prepilin-type N-terminal cleavage/methylation domain-containing protein [Candidatus Carbobacillus sp.]